MPGTSNLFEIMCPEKIRPSGCLDSSRYVPNLDLCSFYSFPCAFIAFLSPALEIVGYSTELAHLVGGWGGGKVGCKEGELVLCLLSNGNNYPSRRWKDDTGG